jgi:hypothetical protein
MGCGGYTFGFAEPAFHAAAIFSESAFAVAEGLCGQAQGAGNPALDLTGFGFEDLATAD